MKQFLVLSIVAGLFSFASFASTRVCVDHRKNTVTLSAHYVFYGKQAKAAQVNPCVAEINRLFNTGIEIQFNKSGPWKKVIVKVTHEVMTEQNAAQAATLNYEHKNNFVRVDTPPKGSRVTVSEHGLDSNYGYFIVSNGLGESTTCSHEFAHGLGLNHLPDPCDYRGKGVPPIMAARGCAVDKKYQYDPKARAGAQGGTVNPEFRQVHAYEISNINLGDLDYQWVSKDVECAGQGHLVRKIYNLDGSTYIPGAMPFTPGAGYPHDSTFYPMPIEVLD
jgi:hypothetical protein